MVETYPLEQADEAYARMMSGKAQFRFGSRFRVLLSLLVNLAHRQTTRNCALRFIMRA